MEFKDYYSTLDLKKDASQKEILKAYRKMARKYHPDLNPNDLNAKRHFQDVTEANEVLSDPVKRKKYDEYGKNWKHAEQFENAKSSRARESNRGSTETFVNPDSDFSSFFESLFGNASSQGSKTKFRGQDLAANLTLHLTDVYKNNLQTLTINNKKVRITIPAGVEDGQTLKITGHGSSGVNGGPNGDLLVTFSIINNTKFKRDGSNLYYEVTVDLFTALLGGEITIDTFDSKVKLTVKPEIQNGTKVRLKGKGFPIFKNDNQFGDLIISYKILIPTNLSEQEKDLYKQLSLLRKN